jgi:hypothetical protein
MPFSLVWLRGAPERAPRLARPEFAPMFLLHPPFFVISVDVTGDGGVIFDPDVKFQRAARA